MNTINGTQPDEGKTINDYREDLFLSRLMINSIYEALDHCGYLRPVIRQLENEADKWRREGRELAAKVTEEQASEQLAVLETWALGLAEAKDAHGETEPACNGSGADHE